MNVLYKIGILLSFSVIITGCPTALTIRNVSAPAINCKFDQDCKITVSDTTEHFTVGPTSGDAFLQSRTFPPGETETIAEGQYAYLYRIDLRNLAGVTALPCVNTFTIDFGPVAQLDYDDDGTPEHIFVVTSGGLGSVAPSSASQDGRIITFSMLPIVVQLVNCDTLIRTPYCGCQCGVTYEAIPVSKIRQQDRCRTMLVL